MSTRRRFLQDCSTLFAAAALAPLGTLAKSPSFVMKDLSLNELSFAMLAAQVNTTFRVCATAAQAVDLLLVKADLTLEASQPVGQRTSPADDYEKFSLIFRGTRQEHLPQRIYKFEHPKLGRFEMFIVPVGSRDATRMNYQAVFNRPAQSSPALA